MKAEQYPYNLTFAGYGHYTYLIKYRGKEYLTTTNNTHATDDLRSEDGQRDGRELRGLRGAKALRDEAIRKHNLR
jgi:hypothetical protein